jgi:hypothetical protein
MRTHAITSAKLVNAYARVGAPELAAPLLLETIGKADSPGSLSATGSLRSHMVRPSSWRASAGWLR